MDLESAFGPTAAQIKERELRNKNSQDKEKTTGRIIFTIMHYLILFYIVIPLILAIPITLYLFRNYMANDGIYFYIKFTLCVLFISWIMAYFVYLCLVAYNEINNNNSI